MIEDNKEKMAVIDALSNTRRKAQKLEVALRVDGNTSEADSVRDATARLTARIDELIGRAMEDWSGSAGAVTKKLKRSAEDLDEAMSDVKKATDLAKRSVKWVGLIDDAVDVAKKLLV